MARKVFFSFEFNGDSHRAAQVRSMGVLEGDEPISGNEWEKVKGRGDNAIKTWIDGQMHGKSCVVVLVGSNTAGRKWINYEIKRAWEEGKGLLGIRIHGLKNLDGEVSAKGNNPFAGFNIGMTAMTSIVPLHEPAGMDSKARYSDIKDNIASWVEAAIKIRAR